MAAAHLDELLKVSRNHLLSPYLLISTQLLIQLHQQQVHL